MRLIPLADWRKAHIISGMWKVLGWVFVAGLVIHFWWLVVAAVVVYVVWRVVDARAARRAAVLGRAEQQHRWVLAGDSRGVYGLYPPALR